MDDKKSKKQVKQSKKVKKDLAQQQILELTEDLKRVQAEYINYKRRSEEEKQRSLAIGAEQTISAILPIIDNLDRAIAHQPQDIADHAWVKGVAGVAKQLDSQLQSIGLKKIGIIGEEFDPNLHDAVSMQEGSGDKEVIIGVVQTGFMLNGNVIRHAMVQVGKN